MADDPPESLVDLEIKLAYQERLIRDLDALVRTFGTRLDRMQRELDELKQSVRSPEPTVGAANEPPPHYWSALIAYTVDVLSTAADLAAMTVLDDQRQPIVLGTLWRDRPAVLAFVRHFGWLHCREHVVQLHRATDSIHAAGGELDVIGNGPPMFIEGFRETTGYVGPIYTDPSLEVYRAAQLKRGLRTVLNVASAARSVGALRRGFRQGRTQGDNLQQGGVLVIARDSRVLWQHISNGPGDNATGDDIVRALTSAAWTPRRDSPHDGSVAARRKGSGGDADLV